MSRTKKNALQEQPQLPDIRVSLKTRHGAAAAPFDFFSLLFARELREVTQ